MRNRFTCQQLFHSCAAKLVDEKWPSLRLYPKLLGTHFSITSWHLGGLPLGRGMELTQGPIVLKLMLIVVKLGLPFALFTSPRTLVNPLPCWCWLYRPCVPFQGRWCDEQWKDHCSGEIQCLRQVPHCFQLLPCFQGGWAGWFLCRDDEPIVYGIQDWSWASICSWLVCWCSNCWAVTLTRWNGLILQCSLQWFSLWNYSWHSNCYCTNRRLWTYQQTFERQTKVSRTLCQWCFGRFCNWWWVNSFRLNELPFYILLLGLPLLRWWSNACKVRIYQLLLLRSWNMVSSGRWWRICPPFRQSSRQIT